MKIRVGIIGCGRIAQRFHIKTLTDAPNAELVALCDERIEIAEELGARYRVKKIFRDYLNILEDKDVDAVLVLTPPESHYEILKTAAIAKKHIFVENRWQTLLRNAKKSSKSIKKAMLSLWSDL